MESDAWQHVELPSGSKANPGDGPAPQQPFNADLGCNSSKSADSNRLSYVLPPTNCDLRISMKNDRHTGVVRLGAVALVERVQLQLHRDQICDIARMQDQYAIWNLRNQYAVLRPTGWRSQSSTSVSSR